MNQLTKLRLLTLVVSEHPDGGYAGHMLPKVVRKLHEQAPTTELHTISFNSWTGTGKLTRAATPEARLGNALLVMGGDGMARLGFNVAAGTEATLELIPVGTRNDFARGVGVPRTVDETVGVIVVGRTRTAGLAHISNDILPRHYASAVVSTGYDIRVNRSTSHIRLRLGALNYGYTTLRELTSFFPLHYGMTTDGVCRCQETILVTVSNTGIFGGGMRITFETDPTNGLLDVTVVGPISQTTLLRLLSFMYSGAFAKHPCVEQFPIHSIGLAGEELFAMGDGEEPGEVPVYVERVPGVLKVSVV